MEFITAIILFQDSKKMIPFFLAFIGLVYIALGVVQPKLRFWLGFAFITFACTLSVFNALTAQKLPVYIVCSIMVMVGVLLVLSRALGLKSKKNAWMQKIFSKLQCS